MNEIFFVDCWSNLDTAWSGTPKALHSAFSKRLTVHTIRTQKQEPKLFSIFDKFTMGMRKLRLIKNVINRSNIPKFAPLFVFGEYSSKYAKNSYCYQDLSVDYLLRMRTSNVPALSGVIKKYTPTFIIKNKRNKANNFYRTCAGVFTMSAWLKEDLIQNTGLPAEKVHHVGGGSNIDISQIDVTQKQGNRFLFIGKNWDLKNGNLVVEAFKALSLAHPEYNPQLYIAGPQQKPDCVDACDNIHFLGLLSHEQLVQYYNLCDYFVMPSKCDAYGLVFAEALCFGLPCIGKNIHAMPEFIQNGINGLLIENDDVDELTNAMKQLLIDGKSMANFVQSHQDFYINQYSWDSVAERIIQVMKNDGYLDSDI